MLGLVYRGTHEEGVRVMFYKSYKTVLLQRHRPYAFNESDDTSKEAENYYRRMGKLGVHVTNDYKELGIAPSNANPPKRTEPLEVEKEIEKSKKVETKVEVPTEESVSTPIDTTKLSEMNDAELSEYLDMTFDEDKIKEIAKELDINTRRKDKSAIIGLILESNKDQLIAYLSK